MSFFFVILFLSLFIPTNYPGLMEACIALPLGIFLLFYSRRPHARHAIDKTALILWIFTIISLILSTLFSRSMGMSILTLIRYIEGCLVFFIASGFTANPVKLSRAIGLFAAWASVFFLILLGTQALTHSGYYNSLTAVNGHHPISYTAVMALPFILALHYSSASLFAYFSIGIGLLLSGARGAWLIGVLFLAAYSSKLNVAKQKLSLFISLVLLMFAMGIAVWTTGLPSLQKEKLIHTAPLLRFYVKDSNFIMRKAFVEQAITALGQSPLIGHGPGTFSLLSRSFQAQPGYFSQYAHSFLLETLAENGIIGSLSFAVLMGYIIFRAVTAIARKNSYAPLGWSILITAIYSVFEVNLNSMPYWILFWAIAGVLCTPSRGIRLRIHNGLFLGAGVLLLIFSITSFMAWLYTDKQNINLILRLAPYNKALVLSALNRQTSLSAQSLNDIRRWHQNDPDILIQLAPKNPALYPEVLQLDPYNTHYLKEYLVYLISIENTPAVSAILCRAPNESTILPCPISQNEQFADFVKEKTHFYKALNELTGNDGNAKFLYILGDILYQDTQDTASTLYLWQKAQQAAPQWGYYYLEVAGVQYHWQGDTEAAQKTLSACLAHPLAKQGCTTITEPSDLYPPGTYADDIRLIPAIQ